MYCHKYIIGSSPDRLQISNISKKTLN